MLFNKLNFSFPLKAGGPPPDTTAPTVTITCAQTSPSSTTPLNFTFTLSEAATDFAVGDITVGGVGGTKSNFAGSGTSYTCDIAPTASGTMTVDVAAGAFHDAAGNESTAATQFSFTAIVLSFKESFTTLDAAPLTTPRNTEPGPGQWTTGADTGPSLAISGGALSFTAAGTNDPILNATSTIARAAGVAVFDDATVIDTNGQYFKLLDGSNNLLYEMRMSSGILSITTPNAGNAAGITPGAYLRHRLGYITRATGAIYVFNNRLVWVSETSNVAFKPSIAARASNTGAQVDEVRAGLLPSYAEADLQMAAVASPANGETMTGLADGLLEFTWTAATGATLNFMFRRTDDDNTWIVRCDQAGSRIYLYEKNAGAETERGAVGGVAQTWTNGTQYRIVVQKYVQALGVNVANTSKITYPTASYNQAVTGAKVSGFTTGTNLIQWYDVLPTTIKTNVNAMFPTRRNAAAALTTPTYEASGEAVHPDVKLAPNGVSWNGYKYWMCMTPYPTANNDYENPSILVSNDKTTWIEPPGITNPISGTVSNPNFYSDGCIVFSPDGLTLYCFYRWSNGVDTSKVYVRSSTNGTTWSAATEILTGSNLIFVSPTVIHDSTNYVMWVVDSSTATPLTIVKRTCATADGVWSAGSNCTTTNVRTLRDIWHIEINKIGATYYMLAPLTQPGGSTNSDLFMATSADGDAWTFDPEMVIWRGDPGTWDENRIYRASGISADGVTWDIWYSARTTTPTVWHIGYTTFTRA